MADQWGQTRLILRDIWDQMKNYLFFNFFDPFYSNQWGRSELELNNKWGQNRLILVSKFNVTDQWSLTPLIRLSPVYEIRSE
ncbi:MAG: hypothetical protein KJO03_08220, partial [Gammaproteobacteria bacterium]|nr:hypothetical protein [Gammaproteobacteria bacterium]